MRPPPPQSCAPEPCSSGLVGQGHSLPPIRRHSFLGLAATIAIVLAIAALPVWAHAQTLGMGAEGGLFIPLSAADAAQLPSASVSQEPFSDAQSGAEPEAPANGWLVRIDRQRLFRTIHGVAEQGSGRLLLNLANGLEFDVVVERTRRTLSGHSLSGRVEGVAGSAVTMVAHAEAVAGTVWTPGAAWELVPLQDGVHAFRKLDFSAELPLGEPIRAQDGRGEFRSIEPTNAEAGDEAAVDTVVDVLNLWTPLAQSRAGGEAQMRAHIDHAVAWTNDAFERSGAEVRLNLVGAELIDYDERVRGAAGDSELDLRRLADPSDGFMDEAHVRRDALGADLVNLTVRFSDVGGRADGTSWSLVKIYGRDSYPASTFAHELGHNLGLSHDRYALIQKIGTPLVSPLANRYYIGYGYVNRLAFEPGGTADDCWRTIMAYPDRGCVSRVPYFSTPDRRHLGAPLGVPKSDDAEGADGPADAVWHMNRYYLETANLRSRSARTDDGDTADMATPVVADSTTWARLTDRDDIDYFRIELPEAGWLRVSINTVMDITLTDKDGRLIADNSSISRVYLEAGVYFIKVENDADWVVDNDLYKLVVSFKPASVADEHGDVAAEATAVMIPSSTAGGLQASIDIDYFRFEVAERGVVRVETTGDTDVYGMLYSEDSIGPHYTSFAAVDDDDGPAANFLIVAKLDPGVYFIQVTGFDGATGAYEINVSLSPLSSEPDDHADSLDDATPIAIGSAVTDINGEFEVLGDRDLFRIEVREPGELQAKRKLRADSYGHFRIALFPLNGDDRTKARLRHHIVAYVMPGSYILQVEQPVDRANSVEGYSAYQASVSFLPELPDGHSIPLFLSASDPMRQSFARIINRSRLSGTVAIHGVDDAGQRFGPSVLSLAAGQAVHFNSDDLEMGNAGKGLPDGLGDGDGDWQLRLVTGLDIEALAYVRTDDGFLTAMHEAANNKSQGSFEPLVPIFNPASNRNQASKLRLINSMQQPLWLGIRGFDDRGHSNFSGPSVEVANWASRSITAQELEREIGDGVGKWRLGISARNPNPNDEWLIDRIPAARDQIVGKIGVMSLLESPTGHLTNLTSPAVPAGRQASLPLFISASNPTQQGFVRVIHHGNASTAVTIHAIDDAGQRRGPVRLSLGAGDSVHFNSNDLEMGNAAKGLSGGLGAGEGDWRLELAVDSADATSEIQALTYVRTNDGFLTGMNALAPQSNGRHEVVIFNPASNRNQVSRLRLINPADAPATIAINGLDDAGVESEQIDLTLAARAATAITAQQLEYGASHFKGHLGIGTGKWRLFIEADRDIQVMSLLESPTGHISNLSSGTAVRESSGTVVPEVPEVPESFRDCEVCPAIVAVPAGSFLMGSLEGGRHSWTREQPQHTVSVSAFAAGAYEVTFAEWDACEAEGDCGYKIDFGWGRGARPVTVTWDEAQRYLEWISRKTGRTYRLLSEAEWEYAARAGTTTLFHTGDTITPQQANYDGRYDIYGRSRPAGLFREQTVPVGSFAPNAFGLYDMHGNVWEWVQDCWNDSYQGAPRDGSAWESGECHIRVYRGGNWLSQPWALRSAFRDRSESESSVPGFRVARALTP